MARPTIVKNTGEVVMLRPNMCRCRYELENGQLLSVFFTREKVKTMEDGSKREIDYIWSVAVHIGKDRKEANRWFHSWRKKPIIQTGNGGLEGLAVAARYILSFGQNVCKWRDEMQIGWSDDKRMRAYRWLLRYNGFTLYEEQGKPQCIAYRNPKCYEWIGNKNQEATNEQPSNA